MKNNFNVKSFSEVKAHLNKERRPVSLLMGNGFSVAFNHDIFTYKALADFLNSKEDLLVNKLFDTIKTKNFELIMQQLSTTKALLNAFSADDS
ncbi:MAG: DUF4917 family protein, partial [Comamonas sp.]|nr:DUF4917 family protein [Candidatus Comamonas equi]